MKTATKFKMVLTCLLLLINFSFISRADLWTQKANYPIPTTGNFYFSIGGKGYVGGGDNNAGVRDDFWEYDPLTDTWTQKADFGGGVISNGCSFSIGNLGYAGMGYDQFFVPKQDFWEYNPVTNTWIQKADFAGGARVRPTFFNVGNKGYVGMGSDWWFNRFTDLWQYDPVLDTWIQKMSLPYAPAREGTSTFVIGTNAYMAGGHRGVLIDDLWMYNTVNNTWVQKQQFMFANRSFAVAFALCDKGYFGTGFDDGFFNGLNDFWRYEPVNDTWTQVTSLPSSGRWGASTFAIGNKAFVGMGIGAFYWNDFYEYTPDSNCVVGIEEFSTSAFQFTISPNPVTDNMNISYQLSGNKNMDVTISDIHGKVIHELQLPSGKNQVTVSLKNITSGVYFIKANNSVKKFIVK